MASLSFLLPTRIASTIVHSEQGRQVGCQRHPNRGDRRDLTASYQQAKPVRLPQPVHEDSTRLHPGGRSHRRGHAQSPVSDLQRGSVHEASKYAQIPGRLCHRASFLSAHLTSGGMPAANLCATPSGAWQNRKPLAFFQARPDNAEDQTHLVRVHNSGGGLATRFVPQKNSLCLGKSSTAS